VEAPQLLFVVAEMLGAVSAGEHLVCVLKVTLGSEISADLPAQQQNEAQSHKQVCKGVAEENERGKHHYKVPVVDTAAAAAFVHHHPCFKGAEEKDADHVTNRVCKGYENEHAPVDKAGKIKRKDDCIEGEPENDDRSDLPERTPAKSAAVKFTPGDKVLPEVLLAAHALKL